MTLSSSSSVTGRPSISERSSGDDVVPGFARGASLGKEFGEVLGDLAARDGDVGLYLFERVTLRMYDPIFELQEEVQPFDRSAQ
jgi:hypothetical protein